MFEEDIALTGINFSVFLSNDRGKNKLLVNIGVLVPGLSGMFIIYYRHLHQPVQWNDISDMSNHLNMAHEFA